MVEIRKGNHSLNVSKSTYETMFKIMGYHIVEEGANKIASSANKNILAPKNNKEKNIDIQEKNQEAVIDVFASKPNKVSKETKKSSKIVPDVKESNPDEGNNKLEDILGIISNDKETSEDSK